MDEMARRRMAEALMAQQGMDPRNQVPGMGSTANALPLENQFVEQRGEATDAYDHHRWRQLLGYGAAAGTAIGGASGLPAALGIYGGINHLLANGHADKARKLGYQGN